MKQIGELFGYRVYEVSEEEMGGTKDSCKDNLAISSFEERFIYIIETVCAETKMVLLFHELMHCFAFQWGISYQFSAYDELLCQFFGNTAKHIAEEYPKFKDWFNE
jgi:hypothetical protein